MIFKRCKVELSLRSSPLARSVFEKLACHKTINNYSEEKIIISSICRVTEFKIFRNTEICMVLPCETVTNELVNAANCWKRYQLDLLQKSVTYETD